MLGEEFFGPGRVSVCLLKLPERVDGLPKHVTSKTSNTTIRKPSLLSVIGSITTLP